MSTKDEKIGKFVYVESSFLNFMVFLYIWNNILIVLLWFSIYKDLYLVKWKFLLVSDDGEVRLRIW